MTFRAIIFLFISLFIFSACGDTPTEEAHEANAETIENNQLEDDAEFFVEYKHDLLVTEKMAELAIEKSTNPRIQEFAKTVLSDVQTLQQKIEKATATHGITLPQAMSEEAVDEFERYQEKAAEEFDEAYLEWFSDYNDTFMSESKEVIAETNHTNTLMEVANAISAQAFAHKAIIDEIQAES